MFISSLDLPVVEEMAFAEIKPDRFIARACEPCNAPAPIAG